MKKIIIYADDDKAGLLTELLVHLSFVKSVETEPLPKPDAMQEVNNEKKYDTNTSDSGESNEESENKEKTNKNLRQLRDALAAIDNARDRNKKNFTT